MGFFTVNMAWFCVRKKDMGFDTGNITWVLSSYLRHVFFHCNHDMGFVTVTNTWSFHCSQDNHCNREMGFVTKHVFLSPYKKHEFCHCKYDMGFLTAIKTWCLSL